MTDKKNNTTDINVVKGKFSSTSKNVDWDKYRDREEVLTELCEAYSALALLAASDFGDSSTATAVLHPINRLFEQVINQAK